MANLRADALHKLTTKVTDVYGIVVVEDLNVVGMLRNRRPARQIAEAGFGEIRRQLTCKSGRDACRIVVADRWFPLLQDLLGVWCGEVKLPLHVRIFDCDVCPLVRDRDENAARNLAALRRGQLLAPEWPKTRARQRRSLMEPTRRPAPPIPATRRGRGGQVAQPCRTSGRQKREAVLKPKRLHFGDVTDLPRRNARNVET
ncbi:zinc ribbon domain-containing protein [Streptomyces sp. NPDC001156]